MTPVFLFSLPRSGSTLLQRLLSAHEEISTTSEPWLLLPLFYARKPVGIAADYDHEVMVDAIGEFCAKMPNGEQDYYDALREFAMGLYGKQTSGRYFLDKTPRYSLIVDDIIQAFPDAKFIFLWRNPLGVAASMIETWGSGRWNIFRYYADLFTGQDRLIAARKNLADRCIDLTYENLVSQPEAELSKIFEYLELQPSVDNLLKEIPQIQGRLGDPTGATKFDKISDASTNAWQKTLRNPLRRWWSRRYLRLIGPDNLAVIGYEYKALLADISKQRFSTVAMLSDAVLMVYGPVYRYLNLPVLRRKWTKRKPFVVQK